MRTRNSATSSVAARRDWAGKRYGGWAGQGCAFPFLSLTYLLLDNVSRLLNFFVAATTLPRNLCYTRGDLRPLLTTRCAVRGWRVRGPSGRRAWRGSPAAGTHVQTHHHQLSLSAGGREEAEPARGELVRPALRILGGAALRERRREGPVQRHAPLVAVADCPRGRAWRGEGGAVRLRAARGRREISRGRGVEELRRGAPLLHRQRGEGLGGEGLARPTRVRVVGLDAGLRAAAAGEGRVTRGRAPPARPPGGAAKDRPGAACQRRARGGRASACSQRPNSVASAAVGSPPPGPPPRATTRRHRFCSMPRHAPEPSVSPAPPPASPPASAPAADTAPPAGAAFASCASR